MKTVALVDFLDGGHHAGWLVQFAETLLRLGNNVVCLCPDPEAIRTRIVARAPEDASRIQTILLNNPRHQSLANSRIRLFSEALGRWREVAGILRQRLESPPDLVFFAWLDHSMAVGLVPWLVDFVFPYRWAGLYFHPWTERLSPPLRPRPDFLKWDACLRSRNCRAVAILDEGVAHKIEQRIKPTPVLIFPDFAISVTTGVSTGPLGTIRTVAAGRTVVASLGSLEPRKGVSTLLRIALRDDVAEFFFVFAGTLEVSVFPSEDQRMWERVLSDPPENCLFHLNGIESDWEFDRTVRDSDILYAAYHEFRHSSNLLAKAAQFQKPIVVSRGFCMEERVNRFSLGIAVEEADVEESVSALHTLRQEIETLGPGPNRRFVEYVREHSPATLERCLRRVLETCDNDAPAVQTLTNLASVQQ